MNQIKYRKIEDLKELENNPRKIKDKSFKILCESLRNNPEYFEARPCILSDRTGQMIIIAGNQRYKAAREIGLKEVPTILISGLTEKKENEITIRDNVNNGEWDYEILNNDWNNDILINFGLDIHNTFKEAEEDNYIYNNIKTNIVYGDMYKIKNHVLLCGDAINKDDIKKLMKNEKADMIFTDPPYNITTKQIYILLKLVCKNTNILIWASDKQFQHIFDAQIGEFKRLYIINTNIASPTNNDVYINHIAILRFTIGKPVKFQNIYNGGRSIINMNYRKNLKDEGKYYKQQKSIKTTGMFIQYWSISGNIVYDPFGGSGTTMAACEQLNRKCYMIENNPNMCQIIINRMKEIYKLKAEKIN
jgi:DNA modification methylase